MNHISINSIPSGLLNASTYYRAGVRQILVGLALCSMPVLGGDQIHQPIDFNRQIRPILSSHCLRCHGPDEAARKAGVRLDVRQEAFKPGKSGRTPLVPGAPDKSEVYRRVCSGDEDARMPPASTGARLSAKETQLLRQWLEQGANYAVHWAYEKPVSPPLPHVYDASWPINEVDRFILARLEHENLRPSPPADRITLLRRVALDLTGLPPLPEELQALLRDDKAGAYEKYVERLLQRASFGEHWARLWLDLARYADSAGYADDPARTIWAYRDYVIRAFNVNKPFDRFTIEQLAGDLLDEPTEESQVATAFHRNTMTNNEGGTEDEEFRNAAIVDRVNTTMAVWMGTSMACAQCHSHKYDPISQREYFQFFAIFNNTEDSDRTDEAPVLSLNPGTGADVTTVPIQRELPPDKRRKTYIQLRGNYRAPGDLVEPGLPAVFPPPPAGTPVNRLTLAKWLVDRNNPLTGRVLANRLWEQIFGIGLLRTTEEFGSQGELPSHPELLDWLAVRLAADWNIKDFLRLLVTSATYRQSSVVTAELRERDPENVLLSRGPRFRPPAEVVRDQALCVSGLLSQKMFGPPVRPPQPSLGLSAAFGPSLDWKTSAGEDQYRRAIYTEWRRTNPYPSLSTFDAPSRELCTLRRPRSNTPLQALVTLNDPVYVDAARSLARGLDQATNSIDERVAELFQRCLIRRPRPDEVHRLATLYSEVRLAYAPRPELASKLAGGFTPDSAEAAAWVAVANVLLNLDEFLMRP